MKRPFLFLLVFLVASLISAGTLQQDKAENNKRVTVLDRVTHIEKDLYLEVPKVPRLCGQLKLKSNGSMSATASFMSKKKGKGLPIVLLHGGPGATHHYFHPYSHAPRILPGSSTMTSEDAEYRAIVPGRGTRSTRQPGTSKICARP